MIVETVTFLFMSSGIANASANGYDLITVGNQASYLSAQWTSNVRYINSNIQGITYNTNPYISYKFADQSNLLVDSGSGAKHLINYGGVYASDSNFNCIMLQNSNYALIPAEDWSIYTDMTISTWFKTITPQNDPTSFFNDTTNLEAWYKFDDATNIGVDSSGKSGSRNLTLTTNDGTYLPPSIDTTNCITGRSSILFEYNISGGVSKPSYGNLPVAVNPQGGTPITFAFWFRATEVTQNARMLYFGNSDNSQNFFIWLSYGWTPANKLTIWNRNASLSNVSYNTSFDINKNIWYHIVFSVDSRNNWLLYVNNVYYDTGVNSALPSVTWASRYMARAVAAPGTSGVDFFQGNIDDFRIYNRVLTPSEVNQLYVAGQNVLKIFELGDTFYDDTTNLVAWYKFNGNGIDMLADSSGNGYNLVNNNNCIFDDMNYRTGNGSVYLNGSSQYLDMPSVINPYTIWNSGNGITVALWFKMSSSTGTWGRMFDFGDGAIDAAATNWWLICKNNTNTTILYAIRVANNETYFIPTTSYIDNQWHHTVWSISSSGAWSIWIDGQPQILTGTGATGAFTGTAPPKSIPANVTWTKRYIGRVGNGTSSGMYYIGNIDDFRIYNRVLTDFEVNTLYTMGDNIILKRENNKLAFQVNSLTVYEAPHIDNTWTHFIWNTANSTSNQGATAYIEINNGVKNYFNEPSLTPISVQYPPYPMTGFENTFNGYTYRACSYSAYNTDYNPWQAFDRNSGSRFASAVNYTNGTGALISGVSFGNDINYKGCYLGIDMGQPFIIDYYKLQPLSISGFENRKPKYWKLYATNNDACWVGGNSNGLNTGPEYGWVQIDVRYNETQHTPSTFFYVTKTLPYRYFAMNTNMLNGGELFDLEEWSIFGYNPAVTIQQFPPVAMTGFSTTYAGITYRACSYDFLNSSPEYAYAWKAFDRTGGGIYRYISLSDFDINGVLNITGVSFGNDTSYKGIYFGIDMGQSIVLKYYSLSQYDPIPARRPRNWKIYATNDNRCWNPTGGTAFTPCYNTGPEYGWTQIDVRSQEYLYTNSTRFALDSNTTAYRYYAFQVNALIGGGGANGGYHIDIYEWQIFGYPYYPYNNRLGSVRNQGTVYLSDFKIHNTPLLTYDEDKLFGIVDLNNNNGVYTLDYTNSIILPPGSTLPYTNTSWNTSNDLTFSTWVRGENIQNGDILFESTQQDIVTVTSNVNNHIVPNNLTTMSFNYGPITNISSGTYNITTANGIISLGNINASTNPYPPVGLTFTTINSTLLSATLTGQSYGNGLYLLSFNAQNGYGPIQNLFNYNNNDDGAEWPYGNYNYTTGAYTSTAFIVSGYLGDWFKCALPYPIYLKQIQMYPQSAYNYGRAAKDYKVYGTNDGSTWVELVSVVGQTYSGGMITVNMTNIPTSFSMFGFVANKIVGGGDVNAVNLEILEFRFIGIEPINDRSYPLLTTYYATNTISPLGIYASSNINVIQPYLWYKFNSPNITEDSGTARINLSNIGTGGTVNTTTFVKGNASVYFANSTANYYRTSAVITNNVPFSIAFWFRIPAGNQNTYTTLVSYTKSPYANANLSIQFDYQGSTAPANKLRVYTALDSQWNTQPTSTTSIAMDTWYHVVYTLDDSNPVNARLYINSILESTVTGAANKVLNTSSIGNFVIGASGDVPSSRGYIGFIDDWRFYDFALNATQVTELYRGRVIFYNTRNIRLWQNNNLLEFQNNGTIATSTSAITLNNTWNHIIWNVSSASNNQGFIRINNGAKTNITKNIANMPLLRFPPAAMTGPVTTYSTDIYGYTGGTYISSASSVYSSIETHWRAFNYDNSTVANTNIWTTPDRLYSNTNSSYLGSVATIISGVSISGEWLQLQLPVPIILNNYSIYTTTGDLNRGPKDFRVAGSNDGITWTLVDSQTNITGYTTGGKAFNIINNTIAYSYYRLVCISNNTAFWVSIQEWELYGFPLYPYTNKLGSINNKGRLFISNFNVITNAMTTSLENSLYATTPDNGRLIESRLVYNNIQITSNEIQVYNTDYVKTYPYLQYEFKDTSTISLDSSSNIRTLNNNGGSYISDYGKNCLVLKNGREAWFLSDNWNNYSNLTISTWFKGDGLRNLDEIVDFYQDPSSYIQIEQYVKYPKEAMTSDTFTSTTTGIVTRVKATTSGVSLWLLFNNNVLTTSAENAGFYTSQAYSTSTGTTTNTYFPGYSGESLFIDLGANIILKQVRFYPRKDFLMRSPGVFRIYATNDTTKFDNLNYFGWDLIHDQNRSNRLTTANYRYGQSTIVNINNNNSYRIYALVVNTLSGTGTSADYLNFNEWELYGKEVTLTTSPLLPVQISGGDYYYAFTNTNIVYNMNILQDTTCDILLVGGGGGGSDTHGGGGGAGALVFMKSVTFPVNSYNIIVGNGGIGAAAYSNNQGGKGTDSKITLNNTDILLAEGGGGGQNGTGGSGGGGDGFMESAGVHSTATNVNGGAVGTNSIITYNGTSGIRYGNIGGSTVNVGNYSGAGGGGAGQAGNSVSAANVTGGNGGDGVYQATINGVNYIFANLFGTTNFGVGDINGFYYFAGGGAGGTYNSTNIAAVGGTGGKGGGGNGGGGSSTAGADQRPGLPGLSNTGGGGGGGGGYNNQKGGNGGSGIVLLRFHAGLKIAENTSNQLTLYQNNKSIYDTTNILDNSWNHLLWNVVNNGTPYGYVKINNKDKVMTNTLGYTLTKYPRQPATANTYTYTDGTVVRISGSTVWTNASSSDYFNAFNGFIPSSEGGWGSGASTYNNNTGFSTVTYRNGYSGEYIQIDLGESIILKSYNIYPRSDYTWAVNRSPENFRIYASNDPNCWTNINHISWTIIDSQTNVSSYSLNTGKTFTINNNLSYRFYVIIVNKIFNDLVGITGLCQIAEWELYGFSGRYIMPLNPLIWYQFNNIPDITATVPLLTDSNTNNTTKFNMLVTSFFNDTTNMIAWYKFDDNNLTADYSGNNRTLTNGGGMVYSSAFSVRGNGSVYSSATTSTYYLHTTAITINNSFTWSFWVRLTDVSANRYIITQGTSHAANSFIHIGHVTSGTNLYFRFGFYNNDLDTMAIYPTSYVLNSWIHLTFTYDWITKFRMIYINGVLVMSANNTGSNPSPGNRFSIGYNTSAASSGFIGYIDDLRIYNRAITATEVLILYGTNTNFYNDTTNLVAWYKFDDNATNMLLDSSGNGYHLANTGGATYDSANYRVGNGCMFLNGSSQYVDIPFGLNIYNIWNNNGITFVCWFKMSTSSAAWSRIFTFADGNVNASASNFIIILRNASNSYLRFQTQSPTPYDATAYNVIDNNWHHVVWTITPSGLWIIYIDGVFVNQTTSGSITNPASWTKQYIGRSGNDSNLFTTGNFDDFRIYNRILTQDEVTILYNANNFTYTTNTITTTINTLAPTSTNLLAWYKFDDGSITADSSGNSRTLTNGGGMASNTTWTVKDSNGSVFSSAATSTFFLDNTSLVINNSFSISIWIRLTDLTASITRFIFSHGTSATTNNLLHLAIIWPTASVMSFRFGFFNNNLDSPTYASSVFLNNWTHLTVTYNWATRARVMYINGTQVASDISSTTPSFANRFIIGYNPYTINGFIGYVDELEIFSKVVTANEALSLYNSGLNWYNDTTNMIAWYKFDDNNITVDSSGNNRTLTNGGGMTYDPVNSIRGNGSLYSAAATTTYYLDTTAITINNSFTISVWVRPTDLSVSRFIYLQGTSATTGNLLHLTFARYSSTNITVKFGFWFVDSETVGYTESQLLNVWTHITVTYDWSSRNRVIYVNGINMKSDTAASTPSLANRFIIGKNPYGNLEGFIGNIDDFRIYNKVLTAQEVAILYNNVPINNLIAWYKFDDNNLNVDSSGNNRTLTNGGGMVSNPNNYVRSNGSLYSAAGTSTYSMNTTVISLINSFSISVWVRPTDLTASLGRWILSQGTTAANNSLLHISINPSATTSFIRFGFYNNDIDTAAYPNSTFLNVWTHLAITYDWSSKLRNTYVNGILAATGTNSSANPTLGNSFTIGYTSLGGYGFIGYIDDLRIFNKVISAQDISVLYRDNTPVLSRTLGYTGNSYLYQNAYLWNGTRPLTITTVTSGLLAYYQFENFNDSSGNNRTLTASVRSGSGATVPTVANNIQSGIFVLGTSSYLNTSIDAWLTNATLNVTNTSFTIAFWIRITTTGVAQYFITQGTASVAGQCLFLNMNSSNNLQWSHFSDDTTTTSTHADMLNTWTHLAFTLDNSTKVRTIYKNGVPIHTFTGTYGSTNFTGTLRVGGLTDVNTLWLSFQGFMDELRVYNRVLSPDEIITIYNNSNFLNVANDNTYLTYYGHNSNIQSLLNLFHNTCGFSIHFVFATLSITSTTSQILYIGNNATDLIRIYSVNGLIYFKVGASAIVSFTILPNTYYILDLTLSISPNRDTMRLNMFVNNALQSTITSIYNNIFSNVNLTGLSYNIGRYPGDLVNDATPILLQDLRVFHYPLSGPEIAALQTGAISYQSNGIYPGYYINKLGSTANIGDLYLSDFRIITDQMTPALEDIIYNAIPEYNTIADEDFVSDTFKNINALYWSGSKKLETNASGVNVKGNVTATGNVLSYYSDMRLKNVVSKIENPVEKIMKINTFKYVPNELAKSIGIDHDNIEVGVSAQDINEVLPEIVSLAPCDREVLDDENIISKSGENYLTVNYQRMVPLLIECIKELSNEIDELSNK